MSARADIRFWGGLGAGVLATSAALAWHSHGFAAHIPFAELPILTFLALLVGASAAFVILARAHLSAATKITSTHILLIIFAIGLVARAMQFGSVPILENDFQRYLWDGAQVAKGLSPYIYAPLEFLDAAVDDTAYWDLAETAWPVIERINHPEYRTVYPPSAQGAFALSYWISPFSLDAWRALLLVFDIAIFACLVMILRRLGRSPHWAALYWWHPLAIKEVANSAHMEPLVVLPVIAALLAVLHLRFRMTAFLLAIGAGVKVWPILLMAPLILQLRKDKILAFQCAAIFAIATSVLFWPVLASNLNETSGFVAFARGWAASSAAILVSDFVANSIGSLFASPPPQMLSRLILGVALVTAIAAACFRADRTDALRPYFVTIAALFLLSPSVTPWYVLWALPLLCIYPNPALLLASVTLGLHYSYFPLVRAEIGDLYRHGIVWLIWLPVWALLAMSWLKERRANAQQV